MKISRMATKVESAGVGGGGRAHHPRKSLRVFFAELLLMSLEGFCYNATQHAIGIIVPCINFQTNDICFITILNRPKTFG